MARGDQRKGERARPPRVLWGRRVWSPPKLLGFPTLRTPSLLAPWGFPQRSPLSLESDKETKKVKDGASSQPSEFVPSGHSGTPSIPGEVSLLFCSPVAPWITR